MRPVITIIGQNLLFAAPWIGRKNAPRASTNQHREKRARL